MLPHQRNKVDISKLTPDEQKAFRLYGKLPARPVAKSQERKYFDSGDWALSRAGKAEHANTPIGKSVPKPGEIPHASPTPVSAAPGSSPPSSGVLSPSSPGITSPGATGTPIGLPLPPGVSSSNAPIPIGVAASAGLATSENSINLSMSPGRVGVGQPLASSPTRSSAVPAPGSSSSGGSSNPLVARLEREAANAAPSGFGVPAALPGYGPNQSALSQSPMVAGTTGNQIGKTQIRRTSQSEGSASGSLLGGSTTSPPPTSGLAQSISAHHHEHDHEHPPTVAEDETVAGMELQ